MGKDFDENDFKISSKQHEEVENEEETEEPGSDESDECLPEPQFKLYNHPEYFKITCETQ